MNEHVTEAVAAAANAYCPYSGFHVGAVVVAPDGRSWSGCNVENAAYGSAVCAEVNALTSAVAAGHTGPSVLYIACPDAEKVASVSPCGNCRQFAHELGVEKMVLTVDGTEVVEYPIDELLPHGFEL
ncbi:MAG: cytidine deaminase [Acidimicrobiia bacterium]|nr:cytidine deaminase [Acidimicrobiia bacterium]